MPGQPCVGKLPDGRYFAVELPEGSADRDPVTNELILQPAAIRLLDRLRVLLAPLPPKTTAARIRILREALGLSAQELASSLQIEENELARWESGAVKPTPEQLAALEQLRSQAARRGIALPAAKPA